MAKSPMRKSRNARVQAMRDLENRVGQVTPEILVRAAANPAHPMHNDFVWDNKIAGHKFRLDQARTIIATIRVLVTRNEKTFSVPAYVRDPTADPGEQGYVSTAKVQTEEEQAANVLRYELDRLQAIFERVREIAASFGLEDDFQRALNALVEFKSRARRKQPARVDGGEARV